MTRCVPLPFLFCLLVACNTRTVARSDAGSDATNDRQLPRDSLRDNTVPDTQCECIPVSEWLGYGTCSATNIHWGCRRTPQTFSAKVSVPPPCWRTLLDVATGCWRPEIDNACPGTCVIPPPSTIGSPCDQATPCTGQYVCLMTSMNSAFCTLECILDNPATPGVNENNCANPSVNICRKIDLAGGTTKNFCLPTCKPRLGANDCAGYFACRPDSGGIVGEWEHAICAYRGCSTNQDCPALLAETCRVDGTKLCPTSQFCVPLTEKTVDGHCAVPGKCDVASGLCAPRATGLAANIGDPCSGDLDCAPTMTCMMQLDESKVAKHPGQSCASDWDCCSARCVAGKCGPGSCATQHRNGYCTIIGCSFSGTFPEKACPPGSVCNRGYPGGHCQRVCDLNKSSDCRGHLSDQFGDYECRAWNMITFNKALMASAPVCDYGLRQRCGVNPLTIKCDAFGLPGNPTKMACRGMQNQVFSTEDPSGFCLDDTSSGAIP